MPFTFVIDATVPLVRVHGQGILTLDDTRDLLQALTIAHAATLPRLVDLRAATLRMFPVEIEQCVAMHSTHHQQHGTARVAALTTDLATYGTLQMYITLSAGQDPDFGVFRHLSEALAWLDIDEMTKPRA